LIIHTIIGVIEIVLDVLSTLILIQAVLSLLIGFNVVNRSNQLVRAVDGGLGQITEPIYRPLRRVIRPTGGIDWSPFLALVAIRILLYVLGNVDMAVLSGSYGG